MVASESLRTSPRKLPATLHRTRKREDGEAGTSMAITSPAASPPTRTLAPLDKPARLVKSAQYSTCSPNAWRRSPIRNIPAPKRISPPITKRPTFRFGFCIMLRLRNQFPCDLVFALLDFRDCALGDELAAIEDKNTVGDTPH